MSINNRQLRVFVFILYTDNQTHINAIDIIKKMDNALCIKHIAKGDNKEHYHCVIKFETPYWLKSLIRDLELNYDNDAHLFHSYTDFNFKSLNDYINYLDHAQTDKEDKYNLTDFEGGLRYLAEKVINDRGKENYLKFLDMIDFIQSYNNKYWQDTRNWSINDWFRLLAKNGYGNIAYANWYKMRDVLKPYITIY